jgi:Zn-dependent protease
MTTTTATPFEPCGQCRSWLPVGALRCPTCGELAHRATLERLSAQALSLEQTDPRTAAAVWDQCLRLLPPDAPQGQQIRARIAMLYQAAVSPAAAAAPPARRDDPLPVALFKTLGSMVISIAVYAAMFGGGWQLATGFVILILIHELGHVAAMKYYGLSASPPIFIPFVGALINLRQSPKNAVEEAVVGIAGPVAGTLASLACFGWAVTHPHQELFFLLAYLGFMINLFNMLPVPPLDGGRVTAAVSPWIWMPGIIGLALWILYDLATGVRVPWMLMVLLVYAWPRVSATLKGRQRFHPYYAIGRLASVSIGAAYVALGLLLLAGFVLTSHVLASSF